VSKGLSPVAVAGVLYLVLHSLHQLPDDLDILPFGNWNAEDLNQTVGSAMTQALGSAITVSCPADVPIRKGEITDCTAEDGHNRRTVRVTQEDSKGHFRWQVIPDAP
jgi:hypothetical protein